MNYDFTFEYKEAYQIYEHTAIILMLLLKDK